MASTLLVANSGRPDKDSGGAFLRHQRVTVAKPARNLSHLLCLNTPFQTLSQYDDRKAYHFHPHHD